MVSGANDGKVAIWDCSRAAVKDGILHGVGPNAVKAAEGGRIFVADQGNTIGFYNILC